jgi:hypothetical protein
MKSLTDIEQVLAAEKPHLIETYGLSEIGLFGSYVRGEQRPDSDVDILIELARPPKIGLIGLIELQEHLSDLLGVQADLVIKSNLRKRIGQRILREVVPL